MENRMKSLSATARVNPNIAFIKFRLAKSIELTARVVLKQGTSLAEVLFHPSIKARSFSQR
jgi:hypothetical protein